MAAKDARIAEPEQRVAELSKQRTEVLEKLGQNPRKSHRPPSRDRRLLAVSAEVGKIEVQAQARRVVRRCGGGMRPRRGVFGGGERPLSWVTFSPVPPGRATEARICPCARLPGSDCLS